MYGQVPRQNKGEEEPSLGLYLLQAYTTPLVSDLENFKSSMFVAQDVYI
jgi:hypothetical protein